MKTKNNLTTGILIGIGVIVLPLILMSTTYTTDKKNTYEIHNFSSTNGVGGFLLNTQTGDVWYLKPETKLGKEGTSYKWFMNEKDRK